MKSSGAAAQVAKAQLQHGLGDPVAVVYIYDPKAFVKVGDPGRDRELVVHALLECVADELNSTREGVQKD